MTLPRAPQRLTPAFGFSFVTRAIQEGIARRKFGQPEMARIIEFFGPSVECVFCGNSDVKRWDHLIAVTHGGETVIGNMVPACSSCDDSKQHKPYDEWMVQRAKLLDWDSSDIQRRIDRLTTYAKAFGYVHSSMADRLNTGEREELQTIQSELSALRIKVEDLIAKYRERADSH